MILYLLLIASSICLASYLGYLMFKKYKNQDHNVEGNFFVNGRGEVGINLCSQKAPQFVLVDFTDQFNSHPCHPCNPHHDSLRWELTEDCGYYQLIISYDVGNVREISYKVIY